jgi:IS30 family transposase
MNPVIMARIIERLEVKWSPEQIYNRLRMEGEDIVSTESIYKFILEDRRQGGTLWKNLRRSGRSRKKRFPSEDRRGKIKNTRSISKRPRKANKRKIVGHWERDLMIGKDHKAAVLAIVDRKSRFNRFRKLNGKHAKRVTKETIVALKGLPKKSMTNDCGKEFADHRSYEKRTRVKVYFCDPYSSYQRGTNENRIGLLRQYFPKKTDLSKVTNKQLQMIEFEINNRPMKLLDWKTPYEVMMGK